VLEHSTRRAIAGVAFGMWLGLMTGPFFAAGAFLPPSGPKPHEAVQSRQATGGRLKVIGHNDATPCSPRAPSQGGGWCPHQVPKLWCARHTVSLVAAMLTKPTFHPLTERASLGPIGGGAVRLPAAHRVSWDAKIEHSAPQVMDPRPCF
jgi:hypothetical protein